jgi:hypothetical protein
MVDIRGGLPAGAGWEDGPMARTRRFFAAECRVGAAHRVIDSEAVAEVPAGRR